MGHEALFDDSLSGDFPGEAGGGPTTFANLKRVKLYRHGKAYVYDLTRKDHRGVLLYAPDVIEVTQLIIR